MCHAHIEDKEGGSTMAENKKPETTEVDFMGKMKETVSPTIAWGSIGGTLALAILIALLVWLA